MARPGRAKNNKSWGQRSCVAFALLLGHVFAFTVISLPGPPSGKLLRRPQHQRHCHGANRTATLLRWHSTLKTDSTRSCGNRHHGRSPSVLCAGFLDNLFGGLTGIPKIPSSPRERNQQIVNAVRAAVQSPRTPSLRLVECEFPAVAQLNKLGDGSLRSSQAVNDANAETALALVRALTVPAFVPGPLVWLVTSTAGGARSVRRANTPQHSLQNGLPPVKSRDICVLLAPCNRQDYEAAKRLADNGNTVVMVNGFAKDRTSVPGDATMAYYLKPLTYNSQIAGYLIRCYPSPWTVLDASGRKVLATYSDADILVPETNTPDLRAAVRRVQKDADERAMRERGRTIQ